ncbi:hypothetical protein [Elioraea tepidiphila]|uniref:hypothetical protein n=1 Tax=Elioraea tepidiphila TaxID=457934 RepID=UPI00037F95AD|nr:hypothetical protein [Elioraea tepidiphila]
MTTITAWTLNEAPDGSPLANASPSDIDMERCDAVLRLNASARRYSVEAVRADIATAHRLAIAALANVHDDAATWRHVAPGDLVPPPAAPVPERIDTDAIRPGDPRWTAEAEAMLALAGFVPDAPEPDRRAARERLIASALAEGWTIRRLGHAILTERAEAAERIGLISTAHTISDADLAAGYALGGEPDPAEVWRRVARPPGPGEVSNATREGF